ncbi:GrpB family protein [Paenibacillus chartarius]|uniref:GrpB family protein n=1 Tax=Paenibacillus chartarius TaxID=747481 RepID=A0ABV6DUS6_9BACL
MSEQNRYAIHVVPYSSMWAKKFAEEKERLLGILAPRIVTIEHVGSTSIPNQEAKPIIDMFAAVPALLHEQVYEKLLSSSGYRHVTTGMAGRHLFIKETDGERTHHLHILPAGGFYERNELLFRDFLRSHPQLVKEYGDLKRMLAETYPTDHEAYTRAKTDFIQRVVDLARTAKGLPLQKVWE